MHRHTTLAVTALGLTLLAASAPAQTTTTLTYQGAIRKSGVLYDGSATITLALFDAPSGGNKVSNNLTFNGVQVDHGVFTVAPDFGALPFSGAVRYVEVAFTGTGDASPTVLPRQPLTAAPLSASTRGIFVSPDNRVGIGTSNPSGVFDAIGPAAPTGVNGSSINLRAGAGATSAIGNFGVVPSTPGGGIFLTAGAGGNSLFIAGAGKQGADVVLTGGAGGNGDIGTNAASGGSIILRPGAGGAPGSFSSAAGTPGAVNIEGTTQTFLQFFPFGFASGRRGYIGTPAGGNLDFNVVNDVIGGTLNLSGAVVKINGTFINASDARDKRDVRPIDDAMIIVEQLSGVRYRWNDRGIEGDPLPAGEQIGFLAQDVEKVLPELVATGSNGRKGVSYVSVVPLLTEAVKEQNRKVAALSADNQAKQKEIDALRARLDALEARLAELK